jgi:hypothetical protein
MAFLSGIALVWFVAFYTSVTPWLVLARSRLWRRAAHVARDVARGALFSTNFAASASSVLPGGRGHFPIVEYDPLRTRLSDVNAVVHASFVVYACWRQYCAASAAPR